jgi:CelD/BcsL family acetyltransferase involved in cellulose biosynthesis
VVNSSIAVSSEPPLEPLACEWDELADRLRSVPFMRPGWIAAWWRAFGSGTLGVLCARRAGRLVGVLPLGRRGAALLSPTNYHTPEFAILAEDAAVMRVLADTVFRHRPRRVSIAFLEQRSLGATELRGAAVVAGYRVLSRPLLSSPYVVVDTEWATYEQRLSKNLRSDLRRCQRRLGEEGDVTFDFNDGTEGLDALLADVFAIEARSWKAARGTAMTSDVDVRSFYDESARWAAGRGCLLVALLRVDGRPVAMHVGIQDRGVHYLIKGSYDPYYRRGSPGKVLLRATLQRAFERGLDRVELLGTDDPYKRAWTPYSRQRQVLDAFAPSAVGSVEWLLENQGRRLARHAGLHRLRARLRPRRSLTGGGISSVPASRALRWPGR